MERWFCAVWITMTEWETSLQINKHHSPSQDESWKPFRTDVDGGGGGGAPAPGLSGGRGGLGPLLGLSIPLLDGNWGVAGRARAVLPFLFIGGGGGRGPGAKDKASSEALLSIYTHAHALCKAEFLLNTHPWTRGKEKWWNPLDTDTNRKGAYTRWICKLRPYNNR